MHPYQGVEAKWEETVYRGFFSLPNWSSRIGCVLA